MKKIIFILVSLCLFTGNLQVYAQTSLKLELLHEIDISSIYIPVGELAFPVLCGNMVYENEIGFDNNCHKIHDLETGKLLKSYKYPFSIDSLGIYTNGKQVVYVHEFSKKIIVYEGLDKILEKRLDLNGYIYGLTIDEKYLYAATEKGIIILDMDGKLVHIINDEISEYIDEKEFSIGMLNDKESLYIFDGVYLYKINKDTYEIIYKTQFKNSYYEVIQNSKYLFPHGINWIDKETGEIVDKVKGGCFAVDEDFIVYTYDKLVAKRLDTGEKLWEKEYIENHTFTPLIDDGYFYIFLDKFYVIDVKTGEVVWEDEPIDYFFEYIPQIMATEEYVTIFVENRDDPKLRIYRKIYQ